MYANAYTREVDMANRPDIRIIDDGPDAPAAVISLKSEHLSLEGPVLADWMDTVFHALNALRSGAWDCDTPPKPDVVQAIDAAIRDLAHGLMPRLEGLINALIRAHYAAGGSHGQLASAMDVSRSTAQSRAARLPDEPTVWERWARGELNTRQ